MRPLTDRGWDLAALAAIGAGALIRLVWVVIRHPPLDYVYSDMGGYVARAMRVAEGAALDRQDAFYPPGTHLLLALPLRLLGADRTGLWGGVVLWWLLSAVTPFFAWRLARVLLTPTAAALTAAFTAAWPIHISYAGYFTSETPSLAFLAASLWLAYEARRRAGWRAAGLAALAGVLGGIAVANRPQFLLNLAIVAVPLVLGATRRLRAAGAFAAGLAVVLAGVVAYNSAAADKLTGLNENGGVTFFIGHCNVNTVVASSGNEAFVITPPPAYQRGGGRRYTFTDREIGDQGFFFARGWDCVKHDGVDHVTILARDIVDMTATTDLWPQVNEPNVRHVVTVTNFAYSLALPVIVFAAIGLARRRRDSVGDGVFALLLHLGCVLVLAVVVFGDPRFRAPYDVFGLALLAAVIADRWLERRPSDARSVQATG